MPNFDAHAFVQANKRAWSANRLQTRPGGDDETRTHYLYNANVALSQMSYAPVSTRSIVPSLNVFVKYYFMFVRTKSGSWLCRLCRVKRRGRVFRREQAGALPLTQGKRDRPLPITQEQRCVSPRKCRTRDGKGAASGSRGFATQGGKAAGRPAAAIPATMPFAWHIANTLIKNTGFCELS